VPDRCGAVVGDVSAAHAGWCATLVNGSGSASLMATFLSERSDGTDEHYGEESCKSFHTLSFLFCPAPYSRSIKHSTRILNRSG
jgi:hypothetical protein